MNLPTKWLPYLAIAFVVCAAAPAVAQSSAVAHDSIRQWGFTYYDSESRRLPVTNVAAGYANSAVIRSDGALFVQGGDATSLCRVPSPSGPFTDVEFGDGAAFGLRSDGTVVGWGWNYESDMGSIPALPVGVTYTGMAAGTYSALLLRSDGQLVGIGLNWGGMLNVPALPPGVVFTKVSAMHELVVGLLSDGTVVAWGENDYGPVTPPPLPAGMSYVDVAAGVYHALALRSDGMLVAWGSNAVGELDVPALPPGTVYEAFDAGWAWSVALRSDGQLVTWGDGTSGQLDVPSPPVGATCLDLAAGYWHGIALWSDGTTTGWGDEAWHQFSGPIGASSLLAPVGSSRFTDAAIGDRHSILLREDGSVEEFPLVFGAPALLPGTVYEQVRTEQFSWGALRSDGQLFVWGLNQYGQANVPALPVGVTYVAFELSGDHTVALRSDGLVEAFGRNSSGQTDVPVLPQGMRYVDVAVSNLHTLLLRSDGTLLHAGSSSGSTWDTWFPAAAPTGLSITEIACGTPRIAAAILSDGTALSWGGLPVPALPWGVYYLDVDCSHTFGYGWLRRSDGEVVRFGNASTWPQDQVPALEPGTSYVDLDGGSDMVITRVGPTCTYVGVHAGCAGSMPAPRLVPRETPRIGELFEVRLFDVPDNVAVMGMGFQQVAPIDLGGIGIPGCELAIAVEGVQLLAGQDQQAVWALPIPDQPSLVGVRFYNQALVLDLNAGTPFGAVMSDAMEGVVGYP